MTRWVLLFCLLAAPASAQTFTTDFNSPNAGCTDCYGFASHASFTAPSGVSASGTSVTAWALTDLPTGDVDGTGAVRATYRGCTGQSCTDTYLEAPRYWSTGAVGGSYSQGTSERFTRVRIRLPAGSLPATGDYDVKWLEFGSTTSRVIHKLQGVDDSEGCSPNYPWGDVVDDPSDWYPGQWYLAADWGFSSWSDVAIAGKFFSFSTHRGVAPDCSGPNLLVQTDYASPPKANWKGSAPVNGWYCIQTRAISGTAGNAGFEIWINNDDFSNPTTRHLNMVAPFGGGNPQMGVTDWENNVLIGGYTMMRDSAPDFSVEYGHFSVSNSFDNTFGATCTGGGGGGGTGPRRLRFRVADLFLGLGALGACLVLGAKTSGRRCASAGSSCR